jgi:Transposase IS116/IS110/IS902 family
VSSEIPELESARRLTRDIKQAAKTLSHVEARYLVDTYYQLQRDRIRADNQVRALTETEEPHTTLQWLSDNASLLERNVKSALDSYSDAHLIGLWSKSIVGIGPVLAAGLLANIDIEKAPTVGHIWRFAGLDPTSTWDKGEKRPWNSSLKTLCWKIGESFVKVSGHADDVYGKLYLQRKAYEQGRNDKGELSEQAALKLEKFKIGKDTDAYQAYSEGKLPPAHLHARAKRWAVKLFLAHWQTVAYRDRYGIMPPKPYVISHLHHAHEIKVPMWPFPDPQP